MAEDVVVGASAGSEGTSGEGGTPQPAPAGSGGKAPIGAVPVSPSRSASAGAASREPVEVTDDMLIRVPGQAKPIPYKEWIGRQNKDYTTKTQTLAQERKQFESQRQQWETERRQDELQRQQLMQQFRQPQAGADPGMQALDAISKMQTISGPVMAQVIRAQQEAFKGLETAFAARDEVANKLYERIVKLEGLLGNQLQERAETSFDGKISGWLKQLDYPAEYKDIAKELYLAYEPGPELDEEFPRILQERITAIEQFNRRREAQRVEEARNQRFAVPGRGGNGVATKPLALTGRESAAQLTEMFWPGMQEQNT